MAQASSSSIWKDQKHFMWFPICPVKYEIKNDRLYTQKGIISTTYDELLLYRVTDIRLTRSISQKLFGTGTIVLCTKVDHDEEIRLENISNPREVKEALSMIIEEIRNRKNVVGKEFFGPNGHHGHHGHEGGPDFDEFHML